jgi:predicted nucleotidyltransferase
MSEEIEAIVAAQRRKNALAAQRRRLRLGSARKEAGRLASRFATVDPSVRAVILFGSVAEGTVRSERFDIDLAVDADEYLRLLLVAEESPFRVDLVDLRAVSAELRARIIERGVVLHGTIG